MVPKTRWQRCWVQGSIFLFTAFFNSDRLNCNRKMPHTSAVLNVHKARVPEVDEHSTFSG